MSEAEYYKEGNVIQETAAAAITAGQVEIKAGKIAVAVDDYASGDTDAEWQVKGMIKGTFTAVAVAGNAGDPVWWDASANAFTIQPCSDAGDRWAGSLAAAMAASATTGYVLLNQENPQIPVHNWQGKTWEVKTANYTVDAQDAGKVIAVNKDAGVITLPATVAGLDLLIANIAGDGGALLSVSPNASDKIMGPDIAGTDDKDQQNTKATQDRWDYLRLIGDGADGWFITEKKGTWAEES